MEALISMLVLVLCVGLILLALLGSMIRIVPEYQRLVVFRLGKVIGAKGPGLVILIPVVDRAITVDCGSSSARSPSRPPSPRTTPPSASTS
jgi:SPFH domain, Band 7 family protein